jgi:hypothetical protein
MKFVADRPFIPMSRPQARGAAGPPPSLQDDRIYIELINASAMRLAPSARRA